MSAIVCNKCAAVGESSDAPLVCWACFEKLRSQLDTATRALERLELFLRDAKDCAKFIEHAQGMLAHAHGIAAAALAQVEGVQK